MEHQLRPVLDYGPPPARRWRRWRVPWVLLGTPMLVAASSLATAYYEAIHEPFYMTATGLDLVVLQVLPILLVAAWPVWAAAAVLQRTRQRRHLALVATLVLLALPLAVWSGRETLRARWYFELDQARVAEWEREAAGEASRGRGAEAAG